MDVRLIAATNRDIHRSHPPEQFPRGLVSPAQCRAIPPAALARARRTTSFCWPRISCSISTRTMNKHMRGIGRGGAEQTARPSLAGQRARIAQRHRARRHFGNRRRKFSRPACRISISRAACASPKAIIISGNKSLDENDGRIRAASHRTLRWNRAATTFPKRPSNSKSAATPCVTACSGSTFPIGTEDDNQTAGKDA